MTMLVIQHPVDDFARWKKAFDSDPAGRGPSGVVRHAIYRPIDDPGYVVINLEFSSSEEAQQFLKNPGLRKAWQGFFGVEEPDDVEELETRIFEEVERVDY